MNSWEEKQQKKADRYKELARKHKTESENRFNQFHNQLQAIPLGQPILVGHHSEKAHRSHLRRIDSHMAKSIEHDNKAEYYEKKAKNAENPNFISSDDPEALVKLKEKLAKMEEQRAAYKEYNKKARKEGKDSLPAYVLSNLSQNIRTVKQRIEHLERMNKLEDSEEIINGIRVKIDTEDNRVKMFFDDIPPVETRKKLKQNGFKWSSYNKAWQRMLNDWSIYLAKTLAKELI